MLGTGTRLVVAAATAALALCACTSADTDTAAVTVTTQSRTPSTSQDPTPSPGSGPPSAVVQSASPDAKSKEALGDVKLGAITVDAKSGSPAAKVAITNNSSKLSNYIVDLSITTADGKTKIDATIVSAQGLAPGKTTNKTAQFRTTEKLPKDAKLAIVDVARLAP